MTTFESPSGALTEPVKIAWHQDALPFMRLPFLARFTIAYHLIVQAGCVLRARRWSIGSIERPPRQWG